MDSMPREMEPKIEWKYSAFFSLVREKWRDCDLGRSRRVGYGCLAVFNSGLSRVTRDSRQRTDTLASVMSANSQESSSSRVSGVDKAPEGYPPASFASRIQLPNGDLAELTYDSLDQGGRIQKAIDAVRGDDAGAVAVFLGTTRDNFQGKMQKANFPLLH